MRKRLSIFFTNTIDIFILWLEECVKPLLDAKEDMLTYREQLEETIDSKAATIQVDGPDVSSTDNLPPNVIQFPLNNNFYNISDDDTFHNTSNEIPFHSIMDDTVEAMGGKVEYTEHIEDMDDDLDFDSERVVFITLPWGQIVPIPFTGDQWKMVYEISQESGEPMHKIVEDTVQQRFELATYMTEDYIDKNFLGGRDIDDDYTDTDE